MAGSPRTQWHLLPANYIVPRLLFGSKSVNDVPGEFGLLTAHGAPVARATTCPSQSQIRGFKCQRVMSEMGYLIASDLPAADGLVPGAVQPVVFIVASSPVDKSLANRKQYAKLGTHVV